MGRRLLPLALALWASVAFATVIKQPNATFQYPNAVPFQMSTDAGVTPSTPSTGILVYPKSGKLCSLDTGGNENCTGGAGGGGYATIQDETVPLTQRSTVNFTGAGVTCVDNAGATRTDCTVGGAGATTFDVIGNGTNTTANAMVVGNGASLTASGTGVLRASDVVCSSCINLTTEVSGVLPLANGGTGLSAAADDTALVSNGAAWQAKSLPNCTTPGCALQYVTGSNTFQPNTAIQAADVVCSSCVDLTSEVTGVLPVANGGTNLTAALDDNVMLGNGTTWQSKALSDCKGPTNAVTYDATANNFGCNNIASSTSFSTLTGGTNTVPAAMVVGNGSSMDFSGTGTIRASDVSCTGCVSLLTEVSNTLPAANGGTGTATPGEDNVLIGTGGVAWTQEALPSCNTATSTLQYNSAGPAGVFACDTSRMNSFTVHGGAGGNVTVNDSTTLNLTSTNSLLISGNNGTKTVNAVLNSGTCTTLGSALNYNSSTDTLTCASNVSGVIRVDSLAGVDCSGATNSRIGLQNALNSLPNTGTTILLPSNCTLGLDSPGVGLNNAAITLPNNIHILCEDQSAGFFALRQYCNNAGTYPGSHCLTNSDCLGGGTCISSFGASANPPTSAQQFASAAGTHWMFRDAGVLSSDVVIENCSFWTYQADPYQSCNGGANTTRACRQECDNASTTPGLRCEVNADCGAGTCLRVADCHTGGGTCNSAPGNTSGSNPINVLDLSNTFNARLDGVSIYDHFNGDFSIKTGGNANMRAVNAAREISDGTSPITTTPSSSTCFTTSAGKCNYGALGIIGNGNTQPTTAVTNAVSVGADSQLLRVTARGSTTSFVGGARTRIDECTTAPIGPVSGFDPAQGFGPGTPAQGYSLTDFGIVAKSYALNLIGSGTGIVLNGTASGAIANKLAFNAQASGGTGISLTGTQHHVVSNTISGLTGAATGVNIAGTGSSVVTETQIVNEAGTGTGINIASANNQVKVSNITLSGSGQNGIKQTSGSSNQVDGNFITGLAGASTGINIVAGTNGSFTNNTMNFAGTTIGIDVKSGQEIISGNQLTSTADGNQVGIFLDTGSGTESVQNNTMNLRASIQTPTNQQVGIKGIASQTRIIGNHILGGWRGVSAETTACGALTNTQIIGNRIVGNSGACISQGGAGVFADGNYCNSSGNTKWSGSCDPTCSNGGAICTLDTDCTACNGSVQKCNPEPAFAWLGSPNGGSCGGGAIATHNTYSKNVVFMAGGVPSKQCTVAGNIGQICEVANCNGGAGTCSGTPAVCGAGSGADTGKLCCQTAAGATCAARVRTDFIRLPDFAAAGSFSNINIALNTLFPATVADNITGIDMQGTASLGNLNFQNGQIVDNILEGSVTFGTPCTNCEAILFPTSFNTISGNSISGNNFRDWATPATTGQIKNFQGAFGNLSLLNGTILQGTGTGLRATAGNDFFPINMWQAANATEATAGINSFIPTGALSVWKMACNVSVTPGVGNTRDFFVRAAGASSALKCTITGNGPTTCQPTAGANSAPFAVSAGQAMDFLDTATSTPAAATGNCTIYVSYDTVF